MSTLRIAEAPADADLTDAALGRLYPIGASEARSQSPRRLSRYRPGPQSRAPVKPSKVVTRKIAFSPSPLAYSLRLSAVSSISPVAMRMTGTALPTHVGGALFVFKASGHS